MLVTSSFDSIVTPNAIALGNFDGIHRGHQQVLKPIFNPDCWRDVVSQNSVYATVVTFNPHPKEFFTGKKRQLLTPLNEKILLLDHLGVQQLILLPFSRELASLSPQQFVEDILIKRLGACLISVGEDFRFGHQRQGNAEDLEAIAEKKGVTTIIAREETLEIAGEGDIRISSSYIREKLRQGDLENARKMLGRNYCLTGKVIEGQKLGRIIGFPTANLDIGAEKFLPKPGVYAVTVSCQGKGEINLKGVMNLGCRPTVSGSSNTSVEVHILDWSGDLYNEVLTLELAHYLRAEAKFPSLDQLQQQIRVDCQKVRDIFSQGRI